MGDVNFMSSQVRSEVRSCDDSCEERSAPSLAEGKKAVVQANTTTCLECCDQSVDEIRCPMVNSSGSVTILLVSGLVGCENCRFEAALGMRERTGSLDVSAQGNPFSIAGHRHRGN